MQPRHFTAFASLAAVAALLAAACSSGDGDGAPGPGTPSDSSSMERSAAASSSAAKVTTVPADEFSVRNQHILSFTTAAGGTGTCVFTEEVATCTGRAPADVPVVETPPFPKGRPGAATVSADGVRYTNLEGVPPAKRALGSNERVELDQVACESDAKAEPTCSVGANAIHLSGAGPDLTASGTVVVAAPSSAPTSKSAASDTAIRSAPSTPTETNLDGDYSEDDNPVAPGTMCGAASGNTLVEVESGEISCPDAEAIIDEYTARRHAEGGGNTLAMGFRGWSCSSPTAGRSAELNASIVCDGPAGERLLAP